MSNKMRNLINLVEEAQIDSYLDRLVFAETQEQYNSIISEAELYEAPGMVDKIKKGAMGLGLAGALAMGGQAMADEPVSAYDSPDNPYTLGQITVTPDGMDMKDPQKIKTAPNTGGLNPDMMKHYPTSKHFEVADNILKQEHKEYKEKQLKAQQLKIKKIEWFKNNRKVNINVGVPSDNPYEKQHSDAKEESRQAGHDYLASLRLLSNVVKLDRFKDNPDRLARLVAPATGADAAVENFKLYLQKVKPFEAGPSAERNVPN